MWWGFDAELWKVRYHFLMSSSSSFHLLISFQLPVFHTANPSPHLNNKTSSVWLLHKCENWNKTTSEIKNGKSQSEAENHLASCFRLPAFPQPWFDARFTLRIIECMMNGPLGYCRCFLYFSNFILLKIVKKNWNCVEQIWMIVHFETT